MESPEEKRRPEATPGGASSTSPAEVKEVELVRRSLAGDAEAFGRLVRAYERRVFALASAGLGPGRRADVEDCAQESFLAAYRGLAALREPERFGAWLLGIVRLQVLQALKRRRRAPAPLPEGLEAAPAASGSGEALVGMLSRLPEAEREAVALRHLAGRAPTEIARDLELPEGTVRSRISRGLARLRALLTEEGP